MYNEDGRSFTKSIAFLICVAKNVSNFETNKLKLLSPMIAKRPKAPSSLVQLIRVFLGFRSQQTLIVSPRSSVRLSAA